MLTEKQRRFADAWDPKLPASHASRAAGYSGDRQQLAVVASRLVRNPKVRARIVERLGTSALERAPSSSRARSAEASPESPASDPTGPSTGAPRSEPTPPASERRRVPGEGSNGERVALLMRIGRSTKTPPKDRIAALREAGKLAGDLERPRERRSRVLPPAEPKLPDVPTAPAPTGRPRISLVLSPKDAAAR